ncbi:MAG: TonB-dependent receptor [Gemmatimonadetes bacterium]|nr:TonB-dependent receptor [Gemmatimonadota bacterium]
MGRRLPPARRGRDADKRGSGGTRESSIHRSRPRGVAAGAVSFLAFSLLAHPLGAQARTGTVAGTVMASGDSALAGATILVDGTVLTAVTDGHGVYRITGLPPGRYTVRATAMGFSPEAHPDVEVVAGETHTVDFALAATPVALPGVIVTASRGTRQAGESSASVSVFTEKDIARRDVTQLSEMLPYASGVTYGGGTYSGGTVDIRGSAGLSGGVGSRVLLMLDGHPLLTGDTGEMDFDALPVLGVARVEIVKGPYSALYGSNALGGVVNVITSPIPSEPRTAFRAHAGAYDVPSRYTFADHVLTYHGVEVQQSTRAGPVGLRFFGSRDSDDGFTQNGGHSRWVLRTELSAPLFGAAPSSFYVIGAQKDIGEFFGWRSADQRFEVPTDALGDWYRIGWVNVGATVNVLTRSSASLRFSPYVYYDAVRNHFHDNTDYHRSTRTGSSAQLSLTPGGGHALTLGGEATYTTVTSNLLGTPTLRDYALFAQDEITVNRQVQASVGARFDDHSVTPGNVDTQLSPKLGVVYRPSATLSLRGSVSHAFRAPSPVEQFVSTTQYGIQVVPNPDLRPETVTAAEIGATADMGRVWLDGALFQSRFKGLIQPGTVPGQFFVAQFQNVARARVTGVDLSVRLALVAQLLDLDLGYMYLDPEDLNLHQPLPYRSRHTGTATFTVLGGLFNVDLEYRSRLERVLQFPVDPRGSTTLVGLRAAYPVGDLLLQAKISNLLQEEYIDVQERFPGAPRSFTLTLSSGLGPTH